MKTFIVHVSVDAETADRAVELVRQCVVAGRPNCIDSEQGEVAVVLNTTDEIDEQ